MKKSIGIFSLLLAVSVSAATYEEGYTAKSNKAYYNDPNVWVYTSAFAERFAMPTAWVDNDLKGAYAVAFRVEYFDVRMHFPHKGKGVGNLVRSCFFDLYVPSEARIPWKDNNVAGRKYLPPKSPRYLLPQTKEDKDKRRAPIGIQSPAPLSRRNVIGFGSVKENLGGLILDEFEKDVYPGITYIQLGHSCTNPPDIASWVEFRVDKIWEKGKHPPVAHRVDMPASFMQRLYANWYERTGRKSASEWGKILKHKNQNPSKVKRQPGAPHDYWEE